MQCPSLKTEEAPPMGGVGLSEDQCIAFVEGFCMNQETSEPVGSLVEALFKK